MPPIGPADNVRTNNYVIPTSNTNTTPTTSTSPPLTPQQGNYLATLVTQYAFAPLGGGNNAPAKPASTFGSNDPSYDPNLPPNFDSSDGHVAANSLLRLEQMETGATPGGEAQLMTETLGKHKNDPTYLQQYLNTLGPDKTASLLSYVSSLGNVPTPNTFGRSGPQSVQQVKQEYQDVADTLSTLVKSKDFSQSDMDKFVGQFANKSSPINYFAKDVLSKASPEVNQMFYNSAKGYALNNLNSSRGQTMAAYAMQALSQTSMPGMMQTLANVPPDQLSKLVGAAMKGEAAYGNPPSIDEFSKTGIFRPQDGNGQPLNGLSHLMFDAAFAGIGDQFSPAPLSESQAQELQKNLFQDAIGTLESQSNVKSFYTNTANSDGVNMKDALAVNFQNDYDAILKSPQYSGKDGELTSQGMKAFREFFADAVFSPPPSSYALGAIQTIQDRYNSWVNSIPKDPNAQPTNAQYNYGESLGEQMQAMSAGLTDSLNSIRNNSAQADAATKDLFNQIISLGGTVVGAASGSVTGPAGGVGIAIVSDALTHLVDSSGGSGQDAVNQAISELKSHGLDLSAYQPYSGYDLSTNIVNHNYRTPFQDGLQNNSIFRS